jgi:hypothetical protein
VVTDPNSLAKMPPRDVGAVLGIIEFQQKKAVRDGRVDGRGVPQLLMVEVGTWVGNSARVFATVPGLKLFAVDTFRGSPHDITGRVASELGSERLLAEWLTNLGESAFRNAFPLIGDSAFWAKNFPLQPDIVLLDDDHTLQGVTKSYSAWYPSLRRGGSMCGHDYHPSFPGVVMFVRESIGGKDGNAASVVPNSTVWHQIKES